MSQRELYLLKLEVASKVRDSSQELKFYSRDRVKKFFSFNLLEMLWIEVNPVDCSYYMTENWKSEASTKLRVKTKAGLYLRITGKN